jgi:type VII secretion integral membrane protein EccD
VATQSGTGLARLTIATPRRRIDFALPEQVPLAELLPTLLHHLGLSTQETNSEAGDSAGVGWSIRRADGTKLATGQSLAAQEIRDGEVLHLVSLAEDWPEPDYDDLVLAVADGTRPFGSHWYGPFTRRTGLLVADAVLLFGLPLLFLAGPPWQLPAIGALAVAVVILCGGAVLSRALGDAGAGGALGALSLPYAFAGGLLVLAGDEPLGRLAAAHVLVGCVALLLAGVTGFFAIADRLWLFVAGTVIALCGAVGAVLCLAGLDLAGSAAVVAATATALVPMSTVLSVRMSQLPMPDLPQTAQDLLEDRPLPARERVFAAVARAEEFFAGILLGVGVVTLACIVLLALDGGIAAPLLAASIALLTLLRARSLDRPRQRAPLLVTGVLGVAMVIAGVSMQQDRSVLPAVVLLGLLPAALIAVGAGLRYARRRPGPQLGRLADWSEFLLGAAVVPLVAAATGLFGFVRGLGG